MLMVVIPTTMLIPSAMLLPPKLLFPATTAYSMLLTLLTCKLLSPINSSTPTITNTWFMLDHISAPLVVLSTWILPLMIMASQSHLRTEPLQRKRMFIMTCATLQATLIMTFTMTDLMTFYIMFETTLVPTLILITRWGYQAERLAAGMYFLFYTLTGSLPLLIAILTLYTTNSTTTLTLLMLDTPSQTNPIMWLACLTALLVKMPLYGLHLWLPKAHVEAPIAGSMILAAILLKLGGYGMIRILPTLLPINQTMYFPPIVLALWGMIMTSLICLHQPDLKSIIAYSSVSHMGLVTAAILIQTPWSISGAMLMMIAHGLTSSMQFCLANTVYERTHTRTLILTRGLQMVLPLMMTWWLLSSLMNMSIPPTINLLGEMMIMSSLFNWSTMTFILTGLTTLITAIYSLNIFLTTQTSKPPTKLAISQTREHLLMLLHTAPLIMLLAHPGLLF